ncbi:DUF4810 domain-containing protein [Thalassotalea ponticola]|uniref:DUF4810 domain-containing protein n=1 Tax=Thalassotalea ponticola TaxID=1523392 RepID=UPI0025B4802A|nr:DUF4810 domain-containing protein [Thalassotalea ponticola]MDN3651318.1 DUF4810 domain-containing protein [Thalassotalea ponticola]
MIINKQCMILTVAILMSGCASNTMYNWENYSSTLYDLNSDYSTEAEQKHYLELNKIVSKATTKKKVPPGIYFELGMYEAKLGNEEKAKEYFQMELEAYPESLVFVQRALGGEQSE